MHGTRTRKVVREIWARKARTAMVALSIFIGVLGVVTLTSVGDLLTTRMEQNLQAEHMPMLDLWLDRTPQSDAGTIDHAKILRQLRAFPQVTAVEVRTQDRLYWREPDATGFIEAFVLSYDPWIGDQQIEPQQITDGRLPVAGQHEIALERRMALNYGLDVGDTIMIRMLSQLAGDLTATASVPDEAWTIAGIVFDPYSFGELPPRAVYTTRQDFETITAVTALDELRVRFTQFETARSLRNAFEQRVETIVPYEITGRSLTNPAYNDDLEEMHQWTDTLSALGILAMLVSCFLVVTVITTIVIEQRRQIGVMKSLGATRWDTIRMYTGMALVYGALGTIPGVLLGIPAGYALTEAVAGMINVLLDEFTISTTAVITGLVMGLVMPVLAAIIPVLLGTRVTILQAITDLGISTRFGGGRVSRLIGRLPLPVAMRQAIANNYLRRGRLTLIGITLTLAAAAFMGVSAIFLSITEVAEDIFTTYNYDLSIRPVLPQDYDYAAVGALIESEVAGLNGVYPGTFVGVDAIADADQPWDGDNRRFLYVGGFDPATDIVRLSLSEGDAWRHDPGAEGIVITESVAAVLGKRAGDMLTLTKGDRVLTLPILGIDSFPFEGAYVPWQIAAALNGDERPSEYWLRFADDDISGADVDRRIGEIRETLMQHGIVVRFRNQRAVMENNVEEAFTISLIFNIASGVMAAVGAIGLLAMLFMSVFERQREIGVMRSVGARSHNIVAQFLTEGLLIGALAWCVALPLSVGIAYLLLDLLPLGEFDFAYPLLAALYGLAGMVAIVTLASLWPSLAAARKTVSDILRYQ